MRAIALRFLFFIILLVCLSFGNTASASHLYGGEMYYTHISGNKYTVTMVLYGDCGGSATVFGALYSASPKVQVYNGTTLFRTMSLIVQTGAGAEVTPVCPLSLDSTTCHGGTIPGVRRFVYSDTITLLPSTSWKFRSTSYLSTSTSAGRSSSITNIFSPGSSLMSLEATLNNNTQPNSNPTYTTIPTPFFCINVGQEYNIGAVDSNTSDSLVYSLVDGLDASTTPSSTVSYRTGYSATSPLACASGSFTFNTSTGQLTFKPNLAQVSLVVYKVSEYRSGVLVGTSMREMNFIVLSTCSNRSPYGKITGVVGGTASGNTVVNMCKNDTLLTFNINPVDSDGNNINVSVEGLPPGATLAISGNNTTSPSCSFSWNTSMVSAGTYYFYVTYQDNACPLSSKQTVVYTINILPKPVFIINTVSLATCTQKNVFDISPSGSGSPWEIKIFQGSTLIRTYIGVSTSKRDSLDIGSYAIKVTNANGCSNTLNYNISPPPTLTIQTLSVNHPKCYNSTDGSITISGGGGLTPYRYRINGGTFASSGVFTGLASGTYNLQIKDSNNCLKDTSIVLLNPDSISAIALAQPALCNAFSSGSVTIIASGGSGSLNYAMGSGSFGTSNNFNSLSAGTYIFKIRDSNNCLKTISSTVTDSIVVVAASILRDSVTCFNGDNGSISILPSNGLAPYTFALDTGSYSSTSTFTGLTANNYIIHIKDSLGCFLDSVVTISQPTKLNLNLAINNVACNGASTGTIVATGSGGIAPYSFSINSGSFSSTSSFATLSANNYTITIKDANNCSKDSIVAISEPSPINIVSFSFTIPKCVGTADGTVNISASGGTGSLQYSINGGTYTSTSSFSGLLAGGYIVSIKDANNCTKDTSFSLLNPNPVLIQSFSINKPKCYGSADGICTIVANGGASGFQYKIDGGTFGTSGTFTGLLAGVHVISIKDGNDCIKDTSFTIANPDSLSLALSVRKNLCNTSKNGAVRLIASGGQGPYTYEKNASGIFKTAAIFDSLAVGSYTFTVKDANNCIKTLTTEITDSLRVATAISVTNVSCFEGKNGSILLSPYIGASPFTFAIGSGMYSSSPGFNSLTAGTYLLRIKDAMGCTLDTTASVSQPSKLQLSLSVKTPTCFGKADGSISVTGSEGTTPYTYAMDTNPYSSSAIFTGLTAQSYTIHIKDANGCIKDSTIILSQPNPIFFDVTIREPLCHGSQNGQISIIAKGGTPGYQYALNGGPEQSSAIFENLNAKLYTLKIIDANGCIKDSSIALSEPGPLKVKSVTIVNPTCENYADGSILISAEGAIKPYSFALASAAFNPNNFFDKLNENRYLIKIKDSNNCSLDTTVQLLGYPKIMLDSSFAQATKCFGYADGSINLYGSGGNPPLRYSFENSKDTLRIAFYKNLSSRNYNITIIDTTNCYKSFSVIVPQPEKIIINTEVINNDCTGVDSNGRITAIVKGGTQPYEYRWSTLNNNEAFIANLKNGFYKVIVTDAHQCSDSANAEIIYDNCCTPSIPNAFTPNNDGKNDVFRILYKGDVVLKEFSIYNRYGQQVYSSANLTQGWDGNFNGQQAELGVYYYLIKMICGNLKNQEIFLKGDVTLIR